jgi:acyl dehydratase
MSVDKSLIGRPTQRSRVVVERGPITAFARSVKDESPVYRDLDAARGQGFRNVPAPPTFGFSALGYWGTLPELQSAEDAIGQSPLAEVFGALARQGGIVLHGEQEFVYHRPIVAGDVLRGEGKVVDVYEKQSKGRTMTFMITETTYRDDATGEPVLTMRFNLVHRSA